LALQTILLWLHHDSS